MKKKHVTVPRFHNPGKGRPMETLAYLSPIEHEMIRQMTDGTWERGPKGIRSYADDSASSNGVSRGDNSGTKGSGGTGQGGQGSGGNAGGSKASGSPNSGTSTGGASASKSGSSSSQSSSSTGAGGQRGAGSNYGPGSARPGAPSTALGQASQAAQRNAVSTSAAMDGGYYHSFTKDLPGMSSPNQFDRTIRPTNMVTATHVPMDTWSKRYNANNLTPGAQKIHQAITDNAFRTNTPVDFFSGKSARSSGTLQHPLGQALDVRLKDPVTGAFVGAPQIGGLAANPIGNVKPRAGRTPEVAKSIQAALEPSYRQFATGVMNSFMTNPGVYGDFNNQRWGGSFGGSWGKDYMHYDEGRITSAVNADQAALRKEAANYRGPTVSGGTMLAGGMPTGLGGTTPPAFSRPTQVAVIANAGVGEAARLQKAQEAVRAISAPSPTIPNDPRVGLPQGAFPAAPLRSAAETYTAPYNPASQGPQRYSGPLDRIPSPQSIGMSSPASAFANDPRLGVPQGAYPARAQSMVAGDPRVGQTPLGGYPQARAQSQVATDPRVSQTPPGAFPAAPKPASVFAEDPRLASPLGAYPAAPKQKEVQLAWNVPPLGGALPSWKADALGVWGTNRKPSGPAAQPGTIHSQTAEAEPSGSWLDGVKKAAQSAGLDPDKIVTVGTDAVQKLSEGNKKVAEAQQSPLGRLGLSLMGAFGGGAPSGGLLGNPQDRSDRYFAPPQMPQAMPMPQQQMAQAPVQDQLTQLLQMQQQMIAEGADPEELAALQALIDQLSTQEA